MKLQSFRSKALPMLALFSLIPSVTTTAHAYTLDKTNHVITVSPSNATNDTRSALAYLLNRADKTTLWTWKFLPGKYNMTLPMYGGGLQNVKMVSDPANPAVVVKASNFSGNDYLIYLKMSRNVTISGFTLYGKTTFASNANPVWGDSGIYFGSSQFMTATGNKFYNFGDSAIRVTTTESDPVKGVNSFDTKVTNNIFNNIYQLSTTPNDYVHGGTARYTFQGNQVSNLRGSVKFASRTAGATDVKVIGNTINGGNHFGLEINNYNNMTISGNNISNIKEVAVTFYTDVRAPHGFQWGDNITFQSNTVKNVPRGIRFSPDRFQDGSIYTPHNLVFDNNTMSSITSTGPYPSISIVNGKVSGIKVTNNKFNSIANRQYIGIASGSTSVTKLNNMVDGVAYGPQSTTASAETAQPPVLLTEAWDLASQVSFI